MQTTQSRAHFPLLLTLTLVPEDSDLAREKLQSPEDKPPPQTPTRKTAANLELKLGKRLSSRNHGTLQTLILVRCTSRLISQT